MENLLLSIYGKTITKIDIDDDSFYLECGDNTYRAYHMHDCCENVSVYDSNITSCGCLGGTKIRSIHFEESGAWPDDVEQNQYVESFTWTTLTINTSCGKKLIVRFFGESNGYYSENVYFERTHKRIT